MRRLLLVLLLGTALPRVASGAAAGAPDSAASAANPEAVRHYLLGRLAELAGDDAGAMAELTRALTLDPRATGLILRASEMASQTGQPGRALELADRALAIEPGSARGEWLRGAALFNLGRADDAIEPLQAACRADSENLEYLRTLARVAETLDRVPVLYDTWSRVVDLDDEDGEGWFQLATTQTRLGKFAAAESSLDRAVALNPSRPGTVFLRGLIHENNGDTAGAIGYYQEHLRAHANDTFTRRRLAMLLAQQKSYREAFEQARIVAEARPDDPDALQLEADLAFETHDTAVARAVLDRLRQGAPDDPARVLRCCAVLARHDHGADAVAQAAAWASARQWDAAGIDVVARAHVLADQLDSAEVYVRREIAAVPDSVEPRRLLAHILQDSHRWKQAAQAWQDVHDRRPGELAPWLEMGACREEAGDIAGAIDAGRAALSLQPDSPPALNFLGYVLADHERELDQAESMIRRAVQMDPDNGAYVDSFGWVLYRLGRLPEARKLLEKAVSLTGGDPIVHEHLGDVYRDLRLPELARQEYRASLHRDAHNLRVQSKLASIH